MKSKSWFLLVAAALHFDLYAKIEMKTLIERIISGGQTGVDRAALDVALELGIPCGGWCPKGRKAEDGRIPDHYPLQEASSSEYPVRTQLNVEDSDGTLILSWGSPVGGTALTIKLAKKFKKPYFLIDLSQEGDSRKVLDWVRDHRIQTLNVAGPREGEAPKIYNRAAAFLHEVLKVIPRASTLPENPA
jgi:predicted Rossmann-fold nucleotide-binding protein